MKKILIILSIALILMLAGVVTLYIFSQSEKPSPTRTDEPASVTADMGGVDCREIKYETARFSVPEAWKVRDEVGGLVLTPPEAEGSARLEYYPDNDFGVCGTGLRTESRVLMCGVQANVGYYDGSDTWSYISADNGYVMINNGLTENEAEAAEGIFFGMRILS